MDGRIAPKLADLTDEVLFGDVWERPQLSKRDRSLVTCAALVANAKVDQLDVHIPRARDHSRRDEPCRSALAPEPLGRGQESVDTAADGPEFATQATDGLHQARDVCHCDLQLRLHLLDPRLLR